ncbi:MAG: ornithine cyclodeaminase family protein [Ktedonobacterales bacterium]
MTLVLREDDVRALLSSAAMPEVMRTLEAAFKRQGADETRNLPRMRIVTPDRRGVMHTLPAYTPGEPGHPEADGPGLIGLKTYTAFAGGVRFVVLLSSAEDGRLLAIIEADWLGQMRTGGASGVATRAMARDDARVVGLIGAGGQARTQLIAMCAARPIETIRVAARDAAKGEAFCAEMRQTLSVDVQLAATAEEAVRSADIVVTATTTRAPVLDGAWLRPGTHLNLMGSNWADRREVDDEAVMRSDLLAVDSFDQALLEAGDLLIPAQAGKLDLAQARMQGRIVELGEIVAGKTVGRPSAQAITLFKSLGIGLEDVAVGGLVYALARDRGLGEELRLFE